MLGLIFSRTSGACHFCGDPVIFSRRGMKNDQLDEEPNLPEPGVLAREIVDDLEAALEQFKLIAEDLGEEA
ncbi:MAG: hypothetical protein HZB31_02220 [Nitrospirae bacterium]|nr:hypothetical protein [Nitrospirota bacterium]